MIARMLRAWQRRAVARWWLSEAVAHDAEAHRLFGKAARATTASEKQRIYCQAFEAAELAEACRARAGGDYEHAAAREADAEWWRERAAQRVVSNVVQLSEARRHA